MDRIQNKDLFKLAIGEMNMSLNDFNEMTEEEFTLAYEGFLENKIKDANLLLLVLSKYKQNDFSPISFEVEQSGFNQSTMEDREETFEALKI